VAVHGEPAANDLAACACAYFNAVME
jgi:hypothetical protein